MSKIYMLKNIILSCVRFNKSDQDEFMDILDSTIEYGYDLESLEKEIGFAASIIENWIDGEHLPHESVRLQVVNKIYALLNKQLVQF